MAFTCRVRNAQGEEVWAMGAHDLASIHNDMKRDAWCFKMGDVVTIREGRRIHSRFTIPAQFHGWDTTRPTKNVEPSRFTITYEKEEE